MSWLYLFMAGIFEIGWPIGFKLSQTTPHRGLWIVVAIISMGLSGYFLWLAQRTIPIGTAYAIWTGVGAVGTMVAGILFWGDPLTLWRVVGVMMIVGGVVVLKLST